MSDDPELDELARALRAMTDAAPASTVASTRARVVASAKGRSGGPSWALAAAIGLAVVLGGSTVWALFTGRIGWEPDASPVRAARAVDVEGGRGRNGANEPMRDHEAPARVGEGEAVSAGRGAAADPASDAALEPSDEPDRGRAPRAAARPNGGELDASRERGARSAPPRERSEGRSATKASGEVDVARARPAEAEPRREPASIDPAERRAYDAAHALHFGQGDWPRAIRGWDAYLGEFPRGRFGLEARYNRALALVHAGRLDEAREALRPFAEGSFGAYRRSEARALLDALESTR